MEYCLLAILSQYRHITILQYHCIMYHLWQYMHIEQIHMNIDEAVGFTISWKKPSDCQITLINLANQQQLCSTYKHMYIGLC